MLYEPAGIANATRISPTILAPSGQAVSLTTRKSRRPRSRVIFLVVAGLIVVVLAAYSVGWRGVRLDPPLSERGRMAHAYSNDVPLSREEALSKLREEIALSRKKYPAIQDINLLHGSRETGANGFEDLEAAAAEAVRLNSTSSAIEPLAKYFVLSADGNGVVKPTSDLLVVTADLPRHVVTAGDKVCVVALVRPDRRGFLDPVTPGLMLACEAAAGRVRLLFDVDRDDEARAEMFSLVRLCSMFCDTRTRAQAEDWSMFRNRVLKACVLPAIEQGRLMRGDVERVLSMRWTTGGNDLDMWLNNLAHVVDRYQWGMDHDIAEMFPNRSKGATFSGLSAYDLHAYAFHVKTAREHVDEAESNELDLGDEKYVAQYLRDYKGLKALDLADG